MKLRPLPLLHPPPQVRELRRWADVAKPPHAPLLARYEQRRGRPARALRALAPMLDARAVTKAARASGVRATSEREVRAWRAELLDELGWGHLAEVAREVIAIRYPELEGYDPF